MCVCVRFQVPDLTAWSMGLQEAREIGADTQRANLGLGSESHRSAEVLSSGVGAE